ncbi:MAG: hypothetical protein Q7V63_06230 [Gammaproteobacteria bacterium]|nr:hypothetical protein [Gammaproteobacteria bacterium]
MFKKYQDLVLLKIRQMAAFSLNEHTKIEPLHWRSSFISDLSTNYLDIDKGKSTKKPPFIGLVKPDCSNLISILADLKAHLIELWRAKELHSYCNGHVDIDRLIETLNASHSPYHLSDISLWSCTSSSTSPLKATDNPLFYFTSMDRAVAYYTIMLLAESATSFNDCLLGIKQAGTSRYFTPGLTSNKLNIRMGQAVEKAREPLATYFQTYKAIYFKNRASFCTEEEFYKACKIIIGNHIEETPTLKACFDLHRFTLSRYLDKKSYYDEIIALLGDCEDELNRLEMGIDTLEAELNNEPKLIAQAKLIQVNWFSEGSVNEIKEANSMLMSEEIEKLKKVRDSVAGVHIECGRILEPLIQPLLDLKETMDEKEYTLCNLYHSDANVNELIEVLPKEVEDKIIKDLIDKLEAQYLIFKQEIAELHAKLPASTGSYRTSSPITSTSSGYGVTAFSTHSLSGSHESIFTQTTEESIVTSL